MRPFTPGFRLARGAFRPTAICPRPCLHIPWGTTTHPQGLAKSIAWDGEGATCLMEIECVGARNDAEARQVGVKQGQGRQLC